MTVGDLHSICAEHGAILRVTSTAGYYRAAVLSDLGIEIARDGGLTLEDAVLGALYHLGWLTA